MWQHAPEDVLVLPVFWINETTALPDDLAEDIFKLSVYPLNVAHGLQVKNIFFTKFLSNFSTLYLLPEEYWYYWQFAIYSGPNRERLSQQRKTPSKKSLKQKIILKIHMNKNLKKIRQKYQFRFKLYLFIFYHYCKSYC